jgi:hypothetical protein
MTVGSTEMGFFSLKKLARRIARGKMFRALGKIVKNPIFRAILPPQVSMAIGLAGGAAKLIGKAKKGDKKAAAKLKRAMRSGNETAREAMRLAAAGTGTRLVFKASAMPPPAPQEEEEAPQAAEG